jgi:hypothetical protein
MGSIVTAIVATLSVVTAIAASVYYLFGRHIGTELVAFLPSNRLLAVLRGRPKLSDFFRVNTGSSVIEYFVHQFGIRPHLPLLDVLYLEYLHHLLKTKKVRRILIYPTVDLTSSNQSTSGFGELAQRIRAIFGAEPESVEVFTPFHPRMLPNHELATPQFLEMLRYVGSEEHRRYLLLKHGLKVRSIDDFNKYHPKESRLVVLFTHIVGSWKILRDLEERGFLHSRLGFILWETEGDKLGVYRSMLHARADGELAVALGKTLFARRRVPLPVAEFDSALCVFVDPSRQWRVLATSSKKALARYVAILRAILRDNYGFDAARKDMRSEGRNALSRRTNTDRSEADGSAPPAAYEALGLLVQLRDRYDGRTNAGN